MCEIVDKCLDENELVCVSNKIKENRINHEEEKVYLTKTPNGFYQFEDWSGTFTWWMKNEAIIFLGSYDSCTVVLSLRATSFYSNRTLEVYAGDELLTTAIVPPQGFVEAETTFRLNKGENTIALRVPEGCERPSDKPELGNPDSRCISIAVNSMALKCV